MRPSLGFLRQTPVLLSLCSLVALSTAQFNNAEGVDIWCGKAYRATNASFNPGGQFIDPPTSTEPLLALRVQPRMSIYLESDTTASLLIDARISYKIGQSLSTSDAATATNSSALLNVSILNDGVVINTTSVTVGATDIEIPIDLESFAPVVTAYNVSIVATFGCSKSVYTTSTEFYRLPNPDGNGSVSRIDNLYGGLWVLRDDQPWKHIFPYTYYVQWSLYWDNNVTTLDEFASMGYNVIHIVPTGTLGDTPFPWDQFEPYLDRADELGLYLQYDVIWLYDNLTGMIEQVEHLRSHPSLLLWYQSDEPDGKSNPINSTGIARDKIRELDPYHPASLALNCYDFYYSDYAKGGEIILPDVYPISTNTSYSTVYDTVCNATYGCCGCDDCTGAFEDISTRLDEFRRRDDIIGWSKTNWFAPQAFGNETFWTRYPTAAEEVVMTLLAVNHGAKGIVMWDFPTTDEILGVTNRLAAMMTSDAVADFLLSAPLVQTLDVEGGERVDAAIWVSSGTKTALVSVVNLNYGDLNGTIEVAAPAGVAFTSVSSTLWGDASWVVTDNQTLSAAAGLLGLQVSVMVVNIA
ncbi:hypothetical protein BX600DRAFT_383510 [Xylariales sp. PMI_506]|nr:hypothetical protein BX600DRAFT_383510 [Xylariales sp. PMI_506]